MATPVAKPKSGSAPASARKSGSVTSRSTKSTKSTSSKTSTSKFDPSKPFKPDNVYGKASKFNDTVLVAVRCRFTDDVEEVCVRTAPQPNDGGVVSLSGENKKTTAFAFDVVYPPSSTNWDIYVTFVKPCVEKLFKGVNSAIFAYGGTGSGKSYTMGFENGGPLGQLHFAVQQIFHKINEKQVKMNVYFSAIEIYGCNPTSNTDNANIVDLIDQKNKPRGHDSNTLLQNLTYKRVKNHEEFFKFFEAANKKRQVGSQGFNAHSSRSHGIVQICLATGDWIGEQGVPGSGPSADARMFIVDLAGSEPAHLWRDKNDKTGMTRYNEAVTINVGLGALKTCMGQLAKRTSTGGNAKNNSTLTKLLGILLDKTSKGYLRILCTVNPLIGAGGSIAALTKGTLEYGKEIKSIKLDPGVEKNLIAIAQSKAVSNEAGNTEFSGTNSWTSGAKLSPDKLLLQSLQAKEGNFNKKMTLPFGDVSPDIAKRRAQVDASIDKLPRKKRGPYVFENGAVYTGEWKGNVRDGHGIMEWDDGAKYEGEFKHDFAHGKGTFYHASGDVYEGELVHDQAEGYGEYRHALGTIYRGQWKGDRKHGKGVEEWEDGAKYEGDFHQGRKHGHGVFIWANKGKYEGSFRCNAIDGKGCYTWPDGRTYDGEWSENKMHGNGKFVWKKENKVYEGQFVADHKHGFGVFTSHDGRKYVGTWKDGRQHGQGYTEDPATGVKRRGIWEKGVRVKDL